MVRYLFYTIGDLTYQSPLVSVKYGHIEKAIFPGKRRTQNMNKCSQDALEQHKPLWPLHILYTVRLDSCHTAWGIRQRHQRFTRQQLELSNYFKISSSDSTTTLRRLFRETGLNGTMVSDAHNFKYI